MSSFLELMEMEDDSDNELNSTFKPIWAMNLKNKAEVHSWLKKEFTFLLKNNRDRHDTMMENLLIYSGIQFSPDDKKTINDFLNISRQPSKDRKHRLVVNHLYDVTETIVSRTTQNKPQPEVMPANSNELSDRNAARSAQQILNYLAFINRLALMDIKAKRQSLICGPAYAATTWDKDAGDLHPIYVEAKQNGFLDEEGNPIKGDNGKPLSDTNILKTGEVDVKTILPWRVLLQEKDTWNEVDYCFIMEIEDVDKLKKDYPSKAEDIKPLDSKIFDSNAMKTRSLRNETIKITFWHRKTKYMPEGAEMIFTHDVLLSNGPMPYDHHKLPITRLTDIDIEGKLHPESFYSQTKDLQWRHNQLTSDIITNQRMMSKPKWMVPKGRADIKSLGNARTIVQFSGGVPPTLASMNPTPREAFEMRKDLVQDIEKLSAVSGTARRDPPPGVTASVAMRFLSELESQRINVSVTKHNEFIREIYEMMLSVVGTYYDADDGRTLRILGKDQNYEIQDMEIANLSKPYDVIIRNIAGLAESRSAKEARIFDLIDKRPDLLTNEQLIDIFEVGAVDKMTDIITQSLRAAEAENESLLSGKEVPEPAPYEDHITHWRIHIHHLQSFNLKMAASPEDLESLEKHIWLTEFLMFEKAKENPNFQDQLSQLKLFPVYYRDGSGFKPSSKEHQTAMVQGQANRGDDVTGQIPGSDIEETEPFDRQKKPKKEIK